LVAAAISLVVASMGLAVAPAAAADPTIAIRAAQETIEIKHRPNRAAWFQPGLSVLAVDGPFELRVTRADWDDPLTLTRTLPGGGSQPLDSDMLNGWWGLSDFFKLKITNSKGKVVKRRTLDFCPNSWDPSRADPSGPMGPSYPYFCSGGPFTTGMVWGIDQGWATSVFEYDGLSLRGPDGRYTLTARIAERYATAFGVPPELASTDVTVKLKTVKGGGGGCHHCGHGKRFSARRQRSMDVPTIENPDPAILPDLAALPAFGMRLSQGKQQYMRFGATVWLGGASGLHVEGFRRPGEALMDAYQFFYENGQVIGKAPVGSFEYDERRGHNHWHFRQFAEYRLRSEDGGKVVRSKKEAFCLAPTDVIDLTLPGAQWRPDDIGFGNSNCGGASSQWIKEVLPLGWGDTYHQSRPGQSFNITNLPDGTYYLEVEANPGEHLHDASADNNVEGRKVIIDTKRGRRTLRVPPWNGIDTD
jgi:Lysyl oxidase